MSERERQARWPPLSYWAKVTVTVLVVLGVARLVLAVGQVLVLILISLVLALGFQPAVEWLERRGLKRGLAIALGFIFGVAVVATFLWLVLPDIVRQASELARAVPGYVQDLQRGEGFLSEALRQGDIEQRVRELGTRLPETVLGILGGLASFVLSALTVLILTIYFTVNLPRIRVGVARLLRPGGEREEFEAILRRSTQQVGGYVLGQMVVVTIAGTTAFIALSIIGVPFAAALAFFVAILDLIPTVGAVIAAVLASAVAAFQGIPELIATAAFFLVYQQVENYFIQPRVMGRTINMSAAVVIIAVLIGGTLLGPVGAILAIPMAAIVKVVLHELYVEERMEEVAQAERRLSGEAPAAVAGRPEEDRP
ncbi:MAG TPA: AI-2E family transporter [Actinomycetota bacterium]|nr:AI-2E family transporter [Actinomycetota bacterium]